MAGELERILEEAESRQLAALVVDWIDERGLRGLVARAIRIDLALLNEQPELALACLWRRCSHRAEWPRDWVPEGPWLRSLCPPAVGIESAVIEEYRTGMLGKLAISGDAIIGVVGDGDAIAWDRGTARRADVTGLVASVATATWRIDRTANVEGRLAIISDGGRTCAFAIDSDETANLITPMGARHLLVRCDHIEGGEMWDVTYVIDPIEQKTLWQSSRSITNVVVRGDEFVGSEGDEIVVREIATGEVRARWACRTVDDLAIAPDGAVITRHGHVIRVWDEKRAASEAQPVYRRANCFVTCQFSPNGKHLLRRNLLCNGESGAEIMLLAIGGPEGWIEGGPPRNCQRVVDGFVFEIEPWGTSIYDAHSGALVHSHREIAGGLDSTVAFDPNGRAFAILNGRGSRVDGRLVVYSLEGAELYAGRAAASWKAKLGFSTDGRRLMWQTDPESEITQVDLDSAVVATTSPDWEVEPATIEVRDGVLDFGGAAIPCDDTSVIVSSTNRHVASGDSHYELVVE